MVVVERPAGSDRVEPADIQAGAMPNAASRVVRQAHVTVRSTRCQRRWSRAGRTHQLQAHSLHHRRRVATRRGISARSDQQAPATQHPAARSVITCLAVTVAAGLVYVALAELASWDIHQRPFWSGLLLIVVTGAICENAISFDAARARSREQPPTARTRSPGRT
jgi:hypothetical protein